MGFTQERGNLPCRPSSSSLVEEPAVVTAATRTSVASVALLRLRLGAPGFGRAVHVRLVARGMSEPQRAELVDASAEPERRSSGGRG